PAATSVVHVRRSHHQKPPSHASPLPSISSGEDAWREKPWVKPEIAEGERAAIASAAGFPSSPSWSREEAVTAFFQEWTQQVQDILNTKKFGDIAFGDKDFKNAIEYYSKVRRYTFSLNSGAVEELELDSFGLSIMPSSLVSTYSLLVEDVLEVVSDAVVVRKAAASRIQRLSK
ncbi:hypothetical protein S245_052110, partial [Arachis hypogaea]